MSSSYVKNVLVLIGHALRLRKTWHNLKSKGNISTDRIWVSLPQKRRKSPYPRSSGWFSELSVESSALLPSCNFIIMPPKPDPKPKRSSTPTPLRTAAGKKEKSEQSNSSSSSGSSSTKSTPRSKPTFVCAKKRCAALTLKSLLDFSSTEFQESFDICSLTLLRSEQSDNLPDIDPLYVVVLIPVL